MFKNYQIALSACLLVVVLLGFPIKGYSDLQRRNAIIRRTSNPDLHAKLKSQPRIKSQHLHLSYQDAEKKLKRGPMGIFGYHTSKSVSTHDGKKVELMRGPDGKIYQLGKQIGKGSEGVVHKSVNLNTGEVVAIKKVDYSSEVSKFNKKVRPDVLKIKTDSFHREIRVHSVMGSLKGAPIIDKKTGGVIPMQYVEGVPLDHHLADPDSPHSPLELKENAVKALKDLHSKGIAHGDARPANFIVTSDGQVNLIDFGGASELHAKDPKTKNELIKTDLSTLNGNLVGR